jgi:hypothetical protein
MNERITTVLWREEDGSIDPIVIVSAEKTQQVDTVDTLYERIVRAVTTWMKTTEEGRKAWEYASDDFNIGDFANYYDADDPGDPLTVALAVEGVKDLRIEEPDLSESWWGYDASLVDGGDVRQALGEDDEATDGDE